MGGWKLMETKIRFRVEIDKDVEDIINWFTQNYPKEISGWMVGTINKDLIRIKKLLIPHQEVGGASVDTDGKSLIKLRKEYGDECLKIIGHFHSHNTMTNFWSITDETFISQYMETRDRALFLVSSKSNGHRIRLELRNPVNLSIDDIGYSVCGDEVDILGEELKKVIEEKVTECKEIATSGVYDGYDSHGNELIYASKPKSFSRENESYTIGLSNEEINKMINFYNKSNRVVVSDLSPYQYGTLENLGKHTSYLQNNTYQMEFIPKSKEEAIILMKEIREELKSGNYDIERELEDLGY